MATFTERLKELRRKNKLTQEELANFLGVTQRTYRNWEQGKTRPDCFQALLIANFFDVSIDYLVGRVDKECADIGLLDFIRKSRSLGYVVYIGKEVYFCNEKNY